MKFFSCARLAYCFLAVTGCLLPVSAETESGSIKGTVVDERGRAVATAKVTTQDQDMPTDTVEVSGGVVPFVETDDQGRFSFNGLRLGHRYKVYASKEQAGYPNMMMSLYNPEDKALIAKAAHPDKTVDVRIHIGPPGARVKWDVRDATTGSSMNPTIGIERAFTEGGFGGTALPDEGFLVPADTDLIITVSEMGYDAWYYPGFAKKELAAPLRLRSGETKILHLQLQQAH